MRLRHPTLLRRRAALKQLALSGLALPTMGWLGAWVAEAGTPSRTTLIRGGTVVNAKGRLRADVLVSDGRIGAIDEGLAAPDSDTHVIDAAGLEVMPAGIDAHVHLSPPFADDFDTGSKAALAGGITTVGAMSFTNEGEALGDMLTRYAGDVAAKAAVDVILHAGTGFVLLNCSDLHRCNELTTRGGLGYFNRTRLATGGTAQSRPRYHRNLLYPPHH